MKKCFLALPLLLLVILGGNSSAQIPNAGFESWTGTNPMNPDGWFPNNIPTLATPITRSATAHTGSFAVQGSVANYFGFSYGPVIQTFFGYTGRPGMLTGYYNFTSVEHDTFLVIVWLFSNNLSQFVAIGSFGSGATTAGYHQFTAPLEYASAAAPDSAWIEAIIGTGDGQDSVHFGSAFLLDDLAFEGSATGVAEVSTKPVSHALHQNYPNPFNPSTTIRFELPEAAYVRLAVFNLLGEEVVQLVDDQRQAGVYDQQFDASGLASGTYFYRLEVQKSGGDGRSFVQVRKMTILR